MINIAYPDSPITAGAGKRDRAHPRPGEATTDVPGFEPALHSVLATDPGHTALYISGTGGHRRSSLRTERASVTC